MTHRYTVLLIPEPDGSAINVRVPALPGALTWGRTVEEAIVFAREVIALALEDYEERGLPAPPDRRPHVRRLRPSANGQHEPLRRPASVEVEVESDAEVGTPV